MLQHCIAMQIPTRVHHVLQLYVPSQLEWQPILLKPIANVVVTIVLLRQDVFVRLPMMHAVRFSFVTKRMVLTLMNFHVNVASQNVQTILDYSVTDRSKRAVNYVQLPMDLLSTLNNVSVDQQDVTLKLACTAIKLQTLTLVHYVQHLYVPIRLEWQPIVLESIVNAAVPIVLFQQDFFAMLLPVNVVMCPIVIKAMAT